MDDICLDEHYIYWCDVIAEGLNAMQMRLYTDYIHKQFDSLSVYDPETGILNRRGFLEKAARQMMCGQCYRYILLTYGAKITGRVQDVIELTAIMGYFDETETKNINQMWINIRCFHIADVPVGVWLFTSAVVLLLLATYIHHRKNQMWR